MKPARVSAPPNSKLPCPVCEKHPAAHHRLGWECSHVECPRRRPITAAPCRRPHDFFNEDGDAH